MPVLPRKDQPGPRAVIFDLDETLLDSRRAWQHAVEESVASVTGRRVDARPLVTEYRGRPWSHALAVLVDDPAARSTCERLCTEMYGRSSLKRLLVHEGIGMALDHLRGARIEMGAISREPHGLALRQVESTGLDRFLAVLVATPPGEHWQPAPSLGRALTFLECAATAVAYVGCDPRDLAAVAEAGARPFAAAWAAETGAGYPEIPAPGDLLDRLLESWPGATP